MKISWKHFSILISFLVCINVCRSDKYLQPDEEPVEKCKLKNLRGIVTWICKDRYSVDNKISMRYKIDLNNRVSGMKLLYMENCSFPIRDIFLNGFKYEFIELVNLPGNALHLGHVFLEEISKHIQTLTLRHFKQIYFYGAKIKQYKLDKFHTLILDDVNLNTVDGKIWELYPNLTRLEINDNPLKLTDDSFKNLNNLTYLSLRNLNLESIDWKVLKPLQKLEHLDLRQNSLSTIDLDKIFSVLGRLPNVINMDALACETFKNLKVNKVEKKEYVKCKTLTWHEYKCDQVILSFTLKNEETFENITLSEVKHRSPEAKLWWFTQVNKINCIGMDYILDEMFVDQTTVTKEIIAGTHMVHKIDNLLKTIKKSEQNNQIVQQLKQLQENFNEQLIYMI